jgi:hypothetical protein
MTGQAIRRLERIEELMTSSDRVPKFRITRIYVEAADGYPTGRVLIVWDDGQETEEFHDPAAIHKHEIMW